MNNQATGSSEKLISIYKTILHTDDIFNPKDGGSILVSRYNTSQKTTV